MNKLTYKEAYDLVIEAYFRDEIRPLEAQFCICGTLCGNDSGWYLDSYKPNYVNAGYTGRELKMIEEPLIDHFIDDEDNPEYENALFNGMCAALEVLKKIHRERGENVDELPALTKRQLEKV